MTMTAKRNQLIVSCLNRRIGWITRIGNGCNGWTEEHTKNTSLWRLKVQYTSDLLNYIRKCIQEKTADTHLSIYCIYTIAIAFTTAITIIKAISASFSRLIQEESVVSYIGGYSKMTINPTITTTMTTAMRN